MSKSLSDTFNVEQVPTEVITSDGEIITTSGNKIDDDYEETRKNLKILLMQGQDALMGALEVAKQSEHPRAFEVVGNLIKQMADVNQQLMDVHKQHQKLVEPNESKSNTPQTVNNNLYVGTTADLNKLIKNMAKGE